MVIVEKVKKGLGSHLISLWGDMKMKAMDKRKRIMTAMVDIACI